MKNLEILGNFKISWKSHPNRNFYSSKILNHLEVVNAILIIQLVNNKNFLQSN